MYVFNIHVNKICTQFTYMAKNTALPDFDCLTVLITHTETMMRHAPTNNMESPALPQSFGEQVRALRKSLYPTLSGRDFAEKVGIPHSTMNQMELNECPPPFEYLENLMRVLGIGPDRRKRFWWDAAAARAASDTSLVPFFNFIRECLAEDLETIDLALFLIPEHKRQEIPAYILNRLKASRDAVNQMR